MKALICPSLCCPLHSDLWSRDDPDPQSCISTSSAEANDPLWGRRVGQRIICMQAHAGTLAHKTIRGLARS